MKNGMERIEQLSAKDQGPLEESQQSPTSPSVKEFPGSSYPKARAGRRLFTRKYLGYTGLAFLIILGIVGTSFLLIPRPTTRWSFQPEEPYRFSFTSPLVSNGLVYLFFTNDGLEENIVYALSANTGQLSWSSQIDGFIPSAPMIAQGTLYIIAESALDEYSTLYALDAVSGQQKWASQHKSTLSSPTLAEGKVYTTSTDGDLFALDALSGRQIWATQVGYRLGISPIVVTENTVYLYAEDLATKGSRVFALDAASGQKKWSVPGATSLISSLAVANGLVYFASDNPDPQISALNALSGKTAWSSPIEGNSDGENLFVALSLQIANGMAYADYEGVDTSGTGKETNILYALDAHTGQQTWAVQTADPEPTIVNGRVYTYSSNGQKIVALDAHSGRVEWSHKATPSASPLQPIEPEPTIVNGIVYVGFGPVNENTLYALDAASGNEKWSYQTGGDFSTSLAVAKGVVYISINETGKAIQPPGGAPGFSL